MLQTSSTIRSGLRRCAFLLLVVYMTAAGQDAEPVSTVAQLPVIGRLRKVKIDLFPLNGGVRRKPVDFSGANSFRLHFSLRRSAPVAAPVAPWQLKVVASADNRNVLWEFCSDGDVDDIWSGEIVGDNADVIVTSGIDCKGQPVAAEGRSEPQLVIDLVSLLKPVTLPQVPFQFKFTAISDATPPIKQAGRSVAKLIIQRDGGEGDMPCTGFLVGKDLLMTNRHCVRSGSEARKTTVQFDFDRKGIQPLVTAEVKELVLASCDLDFVLLRLNKSFACQNDACAGPLERRPLVLSRGDVAQGQTLVAIQHPAGEFKQFSKEGCVSEQVQMVGLSSTRTDFAHKCDTKPGSSGTPIQLLDASGAVGAVIGLHHLGPRADGVQDPRVLQVNRAVSSKFIIQYISQMNSKLLDELSLQ